MKIHPILSITIAAGACLVQAHGNKHAHPIHRRATTTSVASALSSPDTDRDHQHLQSVSDFETWNPAVESSCVVELGVSYCVGVGAAVSTSTSSGETSTSSPSTALTTPATSNSSITATNTTTTPYSTLSYNTTSNPVTITDSEWPPTQTQTGQPSYCNNWYQANQVDDCSSIVFKYNTWMDADDFLEWNPAVGENCTSIYYGYWYCVGIQPQTSMSSNTTATSLWYPSWTYSAPAAMNTTFVASPTQAGIATDCQEYYITEDGDTCESIVSSLGYLTDAQFIELNPAVGTDCSGIESGYYYCVINGTSLPMPSTTTVLPSAVQTGIVSTCTAWYQADDGDDCDLIVEEFGTFSQSDLLSWNPALQSDCSGLVIGEYYCVAVPGTPTTRTVTAPALATPTTPADTISTCENYWLVGTNDNCTTIATANDVSVSDLESWNPSLESDCSGLAANTYICVGVPSDDTTTTTATTGLSSSTATTTSAPTTATSTSATGATPSPIQTGMASGCIRFYYVEANNDCYDIALDAGVALDDFYTWNPAVKSDCSGLQSGVFVCVGKTGYATTITSGDPVPATPTPTQTGMATGCIRFYDVNSGDSCYNIASDAGVALTDFYSWNPALGTGCAGLQSSTFVCIGTFGPITTIISGPPVAASVTST
ncbi:hypothetical protein N7467_002292 [Penicillium canescens]|nr:hypothetical protein N7467_002292 [Penicillium canescens]